MGEQGLIIRPGHNVWVIARTDRDAPSAEDARESAAAFLDPIIGNGGVVTPFESPLGPDDVSRYYIGAARPIQFRASQTRPLLAGTEKQVYTDQPDLFAVTASRPWYVTAEFDWRGPVTRVEWPHQAKARHVAPLPDADKLRLDWLLLEARRASEKPLWADSSTAADYGTKAGQVVSDIGSGVARAALVAGGLLLLVLMVQGGRR